MDKTFAPIRAIEVNGVDVGKDIERFIKHVEFESCDGMADVGRIRLVNPESYVSDAKIFQPNNEISFFAGYSKAELKFLGRVIIIRQTPNYPQDDVPTVEVVGYSKDCKMMDNEPGGKVGKKTSLDRIWAAATYSDAVEMVADRYGFKMDIDPTDVVDKNIIQKVGMNDYDFVRGLANINDYYFWVDADRNGVWTLHFKHPGVTSAELGQEKIYTFKYDWGNEGSLLDFTPELLIQGKKTKIAVTVTDRMTGRNMYAEVEEESKSSPELDATGDLVGKVEGEYTTASDIRLLIDDYSFEVISNRRFKVESELVDWAQQWFKRMRDSFILSRGRTIGCETLAARQVHNIDGISKAYNGEYFFSKVKHILNDDVGYICEFGARKVVQ